MRGCDPHAREAEEYFSPRSPALCRVFFSPLKVYTRRKGPREREPAQLLLILMGDIRQLPDIGVHPRVLGKFFMLFPVLPIDRELFAQGKAIFPQLVQKRSNASKPGRTRRLHDILLKEPMERLYLAKLLCQKGF
ncbi:MAG TPA: hypothetical protein VN701_01010 [Candidatus Paceibacterota bacterium]|nr:hypothetical protein [Candidatus Paceibacterota bacterium]